MTEKSGIELLEEIIVRLDLLEKKVDVIDRNIKLLSNNSKIDHVGAASLRQQIQKDVAGVKDEMRKAGATGFKNFKFEPSDASKTGNSDILARRGGQSAKHVVVKGKMVAEVEGKAVPLSSVSVKIYNDQDALIKETRTNRAGHWVSHLPPGKYVALFEGELNGKKLLPQNRNFIVPEGQLEFEVS